MADASIPGANYNTDTTGLPLEAQPVGFGTGVSAQFGAAMHSTWGGSIETQAIGKALGGGAVPYDKLKQVFDEQKLDASVFPKGRPVNAGEAMAVANQQLAIQRDQELSSRAGTDQGAVGFVAGLAGTALGDPALLATGLVAGPLLGAARATVAAGAAKVGVPVAKAALQTGAGLATRAATGFTEAATGATAYDVARKETGTAQGDRDITMGQMAKDAGLAGMVGLGGRAAFGARPVKADLDPHLNMIQFAENSAGYAKANGIASADDVVSANANPEKRAYGVYQVTPETAKSLGYSGDPAMLKDPAYNRQVAEANMKKLYQKYGNDPDAIAVAWNAGPGVADKWIKFGRRNLVLPKETQDYLNRIHKGDSQIADLNTASAPPGPFGKAGEQPTPGFVEPQEGERMSPATPRFVPARQMPDGSVIDGTPGGTHYSTMTPEEIDHPEKFTSAAGGPGIEPLLAEDGKMGWREIKPDGSYGPFMDRDEAQAANGGPERIGGLESVHYNESLPSQTDVAAAKTALAQVEHDSEVNVEPVIEGMRAEAEGGKADPQELAKALPVRNSALATPAALKELEAVNRQVEKSKPAAELPTTGRDPHPDLVEMQRLAKEATTEAASLHAGMTGEAEGVEGNKFEAYMKSAEEEFNKSEGEDQKPEFQKALEAAVQCGLKNGVE